MSGDRKTIAANSEAEERARLEEITTEWMDNMTTRLFNEAKRLIEAVEKSKPATPADIATNVRSLAMLQTTLGKALLMKRDREARQETKDSKKHADPKGTIVRRMARIAAAQAKAGADSESR